MVTIENVDVPSLPHATPEPKGNAFTHSSDAKIIETRNSNIKNTISRTQLPKAVNRFDNISRIKRNTILKPL